MSSFTGQSRAPGSFSPVIFSQPNTKRPPLRRVESSEDSDTPSLAVLKSRPLPSPQNAPPRPFYAQAHANSSTGSLQNFSRPTTGQVRGGDLPLRNGGTRPSTSESSWQRGHARQHSQPQSTYEALAGSASDFVRGHGRKHSQNSQSQGVEGAASDFIRGHGRKHSNTQGSFEPFLPTAANSNLGAMANTVGLNTSQIAAQAAMQQQSQHNRQRSQTVPTPNLDTSSSSSESRRPSRGPNSPPGLTLTEASGPRGQSFGGQVYHNGLLGGHQSAAQTAANVVFPKSPGQSAGLPPLDTEAKPLPDRHLKTEKSKVKLFSRPGKIGISKDKEPKSTALPSPSKLGQYTLASLQKMNMSTTSVAESTMSSASSMYSLANSSSATIRPVDQPPDKEKEKDKHKHHFLSRQKHKLSSKEDHHLPLSSAASNSRPSDPNAPSSLYNFNLPPSPGPSTTSFAKSMSGLDLRHGGRALREKKKEEKSESALRESEVSYQNLNEWPGPSSLGSAGAASYLNSSYPGSLYGDVPDFGKFGLNNMGPDDAWPFLKAKLLIIFEGEDLRLPVEDFNRLVSTHTQRCIQKRSPNLLVDDLRDLLNTGFSSLDHTLRRIPDERIIPHLVEMWLFTFTSILPYMQAVFLPLDLEFAGNGPLMAPDQARDFWSLLSSQTRSQPLEVRRLVLTSFRDCVILSRFESLKQIFSRLSLGSLSLPIPIGPSTSSLTSTNPAAEILSTSPPDSNSNSIGRPGTAMSLDPSTASYSSNTTTLIGGAGGSTGSSGSASAAAPGSRSRAISNTSTRSDGFVGSMPPPPPPPPMRSFTPSSTHPLSGVGAGGGSFGNAGVGMGGAGRERGNSSRERNVLVEDSSKRLTETVGRMLQCVSVLASVGSGQGSGSGVGAGGMEGGTGEPGYFASVGAGQGEGDEQKKMEELNRALKLNWLGRGRTGRNRTGLVGGRVNLQQQSGSGSGNSGGRAVEVN